MNDKKKIIEYYNLIAGPFMKVWGVDFFHPHFWEEGQTREQGFAATHEYIFKNADLPPNALVADLGCGIGAFTFLLAQRYAHVTAFDLNRKELKIARAAQAKKRMQNVSFVEGDIMELPYKNAFDAVFLIDVEPHLPNKLKALKRISRALKPGGKLIMTAWLLKPNISPVAKVALVDPFIEAWSFMYLNTPDEYRTLFRKAGFEMLVEDDLHDKIQRCVDEAVLDSYQKLQRYTFLDVAKLFDLSLIKHVFMVKRKLRLFCMAPVYSKALQDAGMFRFTFSVVRK